MYRAIPPGTYGISMYIIEHRTSGWFRSLEPVLLGHTFVALYTLLNGKLDIAHSVRPYPQTCLSSGGSDALKITQHFSEPQEYVGILSLTLREPMGSDAPQPARHEELSQAQIQLCHLIDNFKVIAQYLPRAEPDLVSASLCHEVTVSRKH